ncbi:Uncharacterised protein [Klebsiella variicola]|nr:Uncharacterised protein [Klebsiella variicola]
MKVLKYTTVLCPQSSLLANWSVIIIQLSGYF